jgi:hypothetical protein
LANVTEYFTLTPNKTERLGYTLEMEAFRGDFYGLRIKGWLVPPVSGAFRFWIAADNNGELWLSTDDDPTNIDLLCFQPDPSPQNDFSSTGNSNRSLLHLWLVHIITSR